MRRLIVNLDNDLDLWLSQQVNQNQVVREALNLYKGDITTDTLAGMRQAYMAIQRRLDALEAKFEYYDTCFNRLDKLIATLETRM